MSSRPTRDWSGLPSDLLQKIATNLPNTRDLICFRAVCSSWRSILTVPSKFFPPHFPCLLLQPSSDTSHVHLRIPPSRMVYTLPNHSPHHFTIGSSFGYLLLISHNPLSFSLLNPLTGSRAPLPPLPSVSGEPIRRYQINRAKLIKSDSTRYGFSVMFSVWLHQLCAGTLDYFCCSPGDSQWKKILNQPICMDYGTATDFASCCDGEIIDIQNSTAGRIINATDSTYRTIAEVTEYGIWVTFLVESSWGELLMVGEVRDTGKEKRFWLKRSGKPGWSEAETGKYKVFRLERSGKPHWSEMKNIGNDAVFVDDHWNALCFDAGGYEGCRGNCIYFCGSGGVGLFDIERDRVEDLPCDSRGVFRHGGTLGATWVVPRL